MNLHWPDAIGPWESRAQVCWQHDFGRILFGLDEFLDVASSVGAEVTLVINEDRADPLEIRDLIEYTNAPVPNDTQGWTSNDWRHGSGDSSGYIPGSMPPGYFAWLRSQPGYGNRSAPWKIQYVEVGNEVFVPYCPKQNLTSGCRKIPGQCEKCENQVENGCPSPPGIGRRYDTLNRSCENPGDPGQRTGVYKYIDRLNLFIKAIKSVDPMIKISAVGLNGSPTCQWNKVLVNSSIVGQLYAIVDHPYLPATPPTKFGLTAESLEYSQGIISGAVETERTLLLPEWKKLLSPLNLKLANTEHSAAYTLSVDEGNDFRGALMTAGRFHTWLKEPIVAMALYWHTGMSAMYHDWQSDQPIAGPTGLVYRLYHEYLYDKLVGVSIQNNRTHQTRDLTYGLGQFQAKDLDVLASKSDDGKKLSVFIINRNVKRASQVQVDIGGFEYQQLIQSMLKTKLPVSNPVALLANTNDDANAVFIDKEKLNTLGGSIALELPPASLTVLAFQRCLTGDLNCDGTVNLADLLHWRALWAAGEEGVDTNSDGKRNILDYLQILRGWL